MKRSLEGTEICTQNIEIDTKCFALDIVIHMFPELYCALIGLSRQFKKISSANNWFNLYATNQFGLNKIEKCFTLLNICLTRFKQGLMDCKEYRCYYERLAKGKLSSYDQALKYFDRDQNFNFTKTWVDNGYDSPFRIFNLLSLEDRKLGAFHGSVDLIEQARIFKIEDSVLIELIRKLPGCNNCCFMDVYAAIRDGRSIELIDLLLSYNRFIHWTKPREFDPAKVIPLLIHYMPKIPKIGCYFIRDFDLQILINSAHFTFDFANIFIKGTNLDLFSFSAHYKGGFTTAQLIELYPSPVFFVATCPNISNSIRGLFYMGDEYFCSVPVRMADTRPFSIYLITNLLDGNMEEMAPLLRSNPSILEFIFENISNAYDKTVLQNYITCLLTSHSLVSS
jgi:hypothetical protein